MNNLENHVLHNGIYHDEMVQKLIKPPQNILLSLTPEKVDAWHMASCIPSEAGELFDAIKRWVIYNKELDRANVVEELSDLEFYLEGLRTRLNITREETLRANIDKLSERYYEMRYSDKAVQERRDKQDIAHRTIQAPIA